MAEKLTPQQELAVKSRGGKLLVSAAAGSGKTKVLVDRLLSYLTDPNDPANVDDFLIITYTKAAASELRGKIASKLSERIAQEPMNYHLQRQMQRLYLAKISTVHAFCSDLLREYSYKLDLSSDFRVAEETECFQLQMNVIDQLLENVYENIASDQDLQTFIDTQGFGRNDRMIPEIILKVYNSARCHLDPEAWLQGCIDNTDTSGMTDAQQTKYGKFLIDNFRDILSQHIQAIEKCLEVASVTDGYEKVCVLLRGTVNQLQHLLFLEKWDDIVRYGSVDFGRLNFPKKNADPVLADRIKCIRNACKEQVTKLLVGFADYSEKVLQDLAVTCSSSRGLVGLVRKFSERYDKLKKHKRVLDFGDLEHLTLQLLYGKGRTGLTNAAYEIGDRFREIMVDEYQDSNSVQDAIFMALTQKRNNCFMVGDVKQSIYQFRLADPSIFLEKYESFYPAETAQPGQPRKVLLSSNFRSAQQVISAVNDVFSGCMSCTVGGLEYGEDEMLREGMPHSIQDEPEIELYAIDVQEDTYDEESAFVAERISQLLDGTHTVRDGDGFRPIKPEDIVILLRSPGSVGADFCYALEQRGIRCTMGSSMDLLCTEEIRVLWSLLQTIYNPMLDIPLVAVLGSRVFGFSADELASIRSRLTSRSFYLALKRDDSEKTKKFLDLLEDLREFSRMNNVSELLQKINIVTHLDSIYAAMDDGTERTANLQAFTQYVSSYEATGNKELGQFLEHLNTVAEKGMTVASEQNAAGCVTVMSIHKSKGLEFPVVFLSALSRRFNHESAIAQVLCDKEMGLGLACVDQHNRIRYPSIAKKAISSKIKADDISEEMRVLYVALTRARDRLIMTYAAKNVEKDIADIACRIDYSLKELLSRSAGCPGEWILQTAIKRTEAGELLAHTVKPDLTTVSEYPWKIHLVVCQKSAAETEDEAPQALERVSDDTVRRMKESLEFTYGNINATVAPSKQTATQLKGRAKDQEAAENTVSKISMPVQFRKPSFVAAQKDGTAFGNAVHLIMQHIRYDRCDSVEGVSKEISRLTEEGYLSAEQSALIDPSMVSAFFETDLGKSVVSCNELLREFKFSVLVDSERYVKPGVTDKVLLQGVVDCALIEDDGITVIDFKTDRVTEETLQAETDNYRLQVQAYVDALSRIFHKPVKAAYLYFFRLQKAVEV